MPLMMALPLGDVVLVDAVVAVELSDAHGLRGTLGVDAVQHAVEVVIEPVRTELTHTSRGERTLRVDAVHVAIAVVIQIVLTVLSDT